MNLTDRLRAAEYERRLANGLPVDHLQPPAPPEARVALDHHGDQVIDLTQSWMPGPTAPTEPAPATAEAPVVDLFDLQPEPDAPGPLDPPRGSSLPVEGERARVECEQCGGPCQVDLVDVVNHTVSVSCLSCFHMFRVPLDN